VTTSKIVLYGEPRSRAFRCIWMLEELGLDFQLVPVRTGWSSRASRSPT
jgi:glutathione S-transferase